MKPKIERIVAREGLIIISLLLLGGISFSLDLWSNNIRQLYYADVKEIEPVIPGDHDKQLVTSGAKGPHHYQILNSQGIILQFPKNTNNDVIKQTIKKDFPSALAR